MEWIHDPLSDQLQVGAAAGICAVKMECQCNAGACKGYTEPPPK